MTLKEFAELSGVTLGRCSKEWGGTWSYRMAKCPHCTFNGYDSEDDAYLSWVEETFGETAANVLLKLLTPTGE